VSRPGLTLDAAIGDLMAGKLDVIDLSWVRADPDILRQFFLTGNVLAKGGQNYGYVTDPQIDEWVRQGTGSTDPAVLKEAYGKVQRRVVEQAYVLPGYVPAYLIGAKKGVHGLVYDPNAWPLFSGVWRSKS
jgi:peptide/nickel transport system substrate-binding protein